MIKYNWGYLCSRVSQALILGTTMVANALAFSPNLQKGLVAAEQIIKLIERKPKIIDPATITEDNWVRQQFDMFDLTM